MDLRGISVEPQDTSRRTDDFAAAVSAQGGKCALPNCPGRPIKLLIVTDAKGLKSPVAACDSHRDPDEDMMNIISTVVNLRRSFSERHSVSSAEVLPDRTRYLRAMVERLSRSTEFLYIIYAGPIPFHPTWYHDLRDGRTRLPNMDRLVAALISSAGCEMKMIIGNFDRYSAKMAELLEPSLLSLLEQGTIENLASMWPRAESPIKVCCLDTTLYDLPTVFDDRIIRAGRRHPLIAISDGVVTTDRRLVAWERTAFDRLFEAAYRGNDRERIVLEDMVRASLQRKPSAR